MAQSRFIPSPVKAGNLKKFAIQFSDKDTHVFLIFDPFCASILIDVLNAEVGGVLGIVQAERHPNLEDRKTPGWYFQNVFGILIYR